PSTPRPTRGTWAPTSPASRACSCPISAGWATTASTAPGSRATATPGSRCAAPPAADPPRRQRPGPIRTGALAFWCWVVASVHPRLVEEDDGVRRTLDPVHVVGPGAELGERHPGQERHRLVVGRLHLGQRLLGGGVVDRALQLLQRRVHLRRGR